MPPTLRALLIALYPPALRGDYRAELARSLDQGWARECEARPVAGPALAVVRALTDVVRARWGSRAETRWLSASGRHEPRPWHLLRGAPRDVRDACRAIGHARGFFSGVLLTLALGIGANAAVFSLVKAVVLQPLPYAHEDELVMVWREFVQPGAPSRGATTPRFLLGWRDRAAVVLDVAGVMNHRSLSAQMDLDIDTGAERLRGAFATSNFFQILGARARLGRTVTADDEAAGALQTVVLSDALWRRAFGADPTIVGRSVTLVTGRGARRLPRHFVVIGVLEPAFRFSYPEDVEVWAPTSWSAVAAEPPDSILYHVVGRLRPGVTLAAAASRLAALHQTISPTPDVPESRRQTTRIEPIHDSVAADATPAMALVSGVALLLLVIACATTANALFVRVSERRRELALRTALGATGGRLLRQLLTEGLVLATIGTTLGLALAALLMPLLRQLVPASMPRGDEIALDPSVLAFAAAAITLVTLLAALVPAWRGSRLGTADALKRSAASVSSDRSTSRWRRGLVGLQAALASALLVAATLLLISFWRLTTVPLGFETGGMLTVEMREIGAASRDVDRLRAKQEDIAARVAAIPGVRAVARTSAVPFRGVDWRRNYDITTGQSVSANERQVDPQFFALMRIPLRRGRLLTSADRPGTPNVAVVSEAFARAAFGEGDPIGRTIGIGDAAANPAIVGVVGDVRYASYHSEPQPAVYLAAAQQPSELVCLLIDASPGTQGLERAVRQAIRDVDPMLPAMKFAALDEVLDQSLADRRFYTATTGVFGGLALVLTLAGLVVIVMRTIVERRKELAIRTALGASGPGLRAQVVWQGLQPVLWGVALGLTGAFGAAAALAPFVFGVSPREPAIYPAIGALLAGAAAMAGWLAAHRATRLAPAWVLRAD
jgi:predicted permease